MNYPTYIKSAAWRKNPARLKALAEAGGRCRLCHKATPLEVHHATYERLGCEVEGDLISLCGDCHLEVTSFLRARRYADVVPKRANVVQLRDSRMISNDPTAGGY
jgi:hypothetical protein